MKLIVIAIIIILPLCFLMLCACRAAGMADRQSEKLSEDCIHRNEAQ